MYFSKRKWKYFDTFNHYFSEKYSKKANSTNHPVWPLICRNKPAINSKWFNSSDTLVLTLDIFGNKLIFHKKFEVSYSMKEFKAKFIGFLLSTKKFEYWFFKSWRKIKKKLIAYDVSVSNQNVPWTISYTKSQFLIILYSKNQNPTTGEISVTVGRISGMEARPWKAVVYGVLKNNWCNWRL